jgi:hypothetical protein
MPTVGDLGRLRSRTCHGTTITGAPVASDDFDARMARQPRFDGRWMTIWQKVDDTATLKVADDGAIALATLPREVVDANDGWR